MGNIKYFAWGKGCKSFAYGKKLRRRYPNIYNNKMQKIFRELGYSCCMTEANLKWLIPDDNDIKAFHVFYNHVFGSYKVYWMVGYDAWPNGLPAGVTIKMVVSISDRRPFRSGAIVLSKYTTDKDAHKMSYLIEKQLALLYPHHQIV